MFGKSPERVVGTLFKFNGMQLLTKDSHDIANIKAVTDAIHLATGKCFTFTDLAHVFCSVPISTASLLELAFSFAGLQHTFTWLSWGYFDSFAIIHSLCRQDRSCSRLPPGTQEWYHIDATLI